MKEDHFFYVKWRDSRNIDYKVGILARINDTYYLKSYNPKDNNNDSAYNHGFIGIPTFKENKIYKQDKEMFEFFARRVIKKDDKDFDICKELKKSCGKMQIDSFELEEIPKAKEEEFKMIILSLSRNT